MTGGTDLHTVEEFRQLAVKQVGDSIVRLEDVAEVTLGAEDYDLNVAFSGKRSVFIGIKVAPRANILTVAKNVRKAFPDLQSQLPTGVTGEIVYDSTEFINTSCLLYTSRRSAALRRRTGYSGPMVDAVQIHGIERADRARARQQPDPGSRSGGVAAGE